MSTPLSEQLKGDIHLKRFKSKIVLTENYYFFQAILADAGQGITLLCLEFNCKKYILSVCMDI